MNNIQIIDQSNHIVPTVSVAMLAYNHAKFISEAIESVLIQKTNFDVKIIIAEDCSTDATRQIIIDFQKRYPDKIKLILQNKNVGAQHNNICLLSNLEGKYIAALEGDDYWTDPLKLQKQVDFLESNPDFALCHTAVKLLENNEEKDNFSIKQWNHLKDDLGYQFALFSPLAFTCTALFRNISFINYNEYNIVSGDWMLWVKITLTGKAKFLNETTAVYRQGVGVSVGAVWQKDFNYRARFLLNQLSFNLSLKKNIWIIKGAIYFQLMFFAYKYDMNIFNKIANKFKYNINANRL